MYMYIYVQHIFKIVESGNTKVKYKTENKNIFPDDYFPVCVVRMSILKFHSSTVQSIYMTLSWSYRHSSMHTHIHTHTLMAEAAMQAADLRWRDTGLLDPTLFLVSAIHTKTHMVMAKLGFSLLLLYPLGSLCLCPTSHLWFQAPIEQYSPAEMMVWVTFGQYIYIPK